MNRWWRSTQYAGSLRRREDGHGGLGLIESESDPVTGILATLAEYGAGLLFIARNPVRDQILFGVPP